ncbi:Transmembrane protein 149 [Heterocephalus glaber]|uniref:Transmembrane protein 149 n=1 Tax=Heterocephalus glaber TaxID=10181 RepID=G5BXN1_HETGA|nr:Transmembrane protein 149 [Heterocephalus glaber]
MGLRYFLQTVLLLALAAPSEASQYCGPLQYWNPDNKRCSGCLQPFGPPPYPGALQTGYTGKVPLLPLLSMAELGTSHTQKGRGGGSLPFHHFIPSSLPELAGLMTQLLSRLLDELEVLEELIVLLDPEPGPGGGLAYGTTWHLAARYGLPAA